MIKIKRGLDIPITGAPEQQIYDGPSIRTVAVVGADYIGMKPTMSVKEGDKVKLGQTLFTDKKNPGVKYTALASGTIAAIHRGAKRVLQSIAIDVDDSDDAIEFKQYQPDQLAGLSREQVQDNLVESGLWTALRARPFDRVPAIGSTPNSIFVTAMDTNPLAVNPDIVINEAMAEYQQGLTLLSRLTDGTIYVCKSPDSQVASVAGGNIKEETFAGPHPAGLAGTHIHFLDPVSENKTVWHINYQDVIAMGRLFTTGRLPVERIIALAGPQMHQPRLVRTRLGASTDELTAGQLKTGNNRVISGSVLNGYSAYGPFAFLGRYALQINALLEGNEREFMGLMGYVSPTLNKHSVKNVFFSKLFKSRKFDYTTSAHGSPRAMVPVGSYEEVMPLDILPTQLLRALLVQDVDMAQALGCLELAEEDLALCTYTCPGKYEYGPILRDNLTRIEQEG